MPECLPNEREINVASYQVAGERMLQTVRVSLVRRQPGSFSGIPKSTEELGSIQPTAFLRGENKIAAVMGSLLQPSPQGRDFV